jgi:uncharacterized protein YgbK (DUF1537 family)
MLLGCIGDDFTGSSDLANTLAKEGMRVAQYVGVPESQASSDIEAGVVALKSRSINPADAVEQSLHALKWLQQQGCQQFFFKYCSTFDSTPEGNIGPVAEALAKELDAHKVIVCPAFPGTGRSIYQGYLYVGDKLLNESGMQNHPLTPMTDADLRRWLSLQTGMGVGHVAALDVFAGHEAISASLNKNHDEGKRLIVVDALQDADLREIGKAVADLPLITGGSGVALGLPDNFRAKGLMGTQSNQWQGQSGQCAVLSGSCSIATRQQLALHKQSNPIFEIRAEEVINKTLLPEKVVEWVQLSHGIPLAYSSADPEQVKAVQAEFGLERSAQALEQFFAETARQLVAAGVSRLITAGGETSGAVVEGLGLQQLEIGPEIDPGVPALRAGPELVVALKSGNFGAVDFFEKAARVLAS